MSKGYYAMVPIVFHNKKDKEDFLRENPFYVHINRKQLRDIMKDYEDKQLLCKSCDETHTHGKVPWSTLSNNDYYDNNEDNNNDAS